MWVFVILLVLVFGAIILWALSSTGSSQSSNVKAPSDPAVVEAAVSELAKNRDNRLAAELADAALDALSSAKRHAQHGNGKDSGLAFEAAQALYLGARTAAEREFAGVPFIITMQRLQTEAATNEEAQAVLRTALGCLLHAYKLMQQGYEALPRPYFQAAEAHVDVAAALLGEDALYGNQREHAIATRLVSARKRSQHSPSPKATTYIQGALRRAEGQFKEAMRSLAGGFKLRPRSYLDEAEESLAYFEVLMNPRRYAELPPVVRAELLS